MNRLKNSKTLRRVFIHVLLILGACVFAFPFVWLLSSSLKPEAQIFRMPPELIPRPFVLEHYRDMFRFFPFGLFLTNTAIITGFSVAGTLISCSMVAYSFARLRWPGRDFFFVLLLSTMMLPPQVTLIPLYLIFRDLRWIDTFYPLWVPMWMAPPFYVFLLRQFFLTIPVELEEAAKIDGCTFLGIYVRIMLPLVKPALSTAAIFTFLFSWNDFMGPLIYINTTTKMPLALGLRLLQSQHTGEWGMLMAAAAVMTLPLIIMFVLFQRYFIGGIVMTGLKT